MNQISKWSLKLQRWRRKVINMILQKILVADFSPAAIPWFVVIARFPPLQTNKYFKVFSFFLFLFWEASVFMLRHLAPGHPHSETELKETLALSHDDSSTINFLPNTAQILRMLVVRLLFISHVS